MLSNNPPIADRLALDHTELLAQVDELAGRANVAPREIKTDADLDTVAKLITDARALGKRVDGKRVDEKEPFLTAGREVDAFFKTAIDRLARVGAAFQTIADNHARAKVAEARRKADEDAAKARAKAQRQREIAERAAEAERPKAAANAEVRAAAAEAKAEETSQIAAASVADLVGKTTTASGATATGKTVWSYEITDYDKIPLDLLRPYLKREHIDAALKSFVKFHNNAKTIEGVRIFEDVRASIR